MTNPLHILQGLNAMLLPQLPLLLSSTDIKRVQVGRHTLGGRGQVARTGSGGGIRSQDVVDGERGEGIRSQDGSYTLWCTVGQFDRRGCCK